MKKIQSLNFPLWYLCEAREVVCWRSWRVSVDARHASYRYWVQRRWENMAQKISISEIWVSLTWAAWSKLLIQWEEIHLCMYVFPASWPLWSETRLVVKPRRFDSCKWLSTPQESRFLLVIIMAIFMCLTLAETGIEYIFPVSFHKCSVMHHKTFTVLYYVSYVIVWQIQAGPENRPSMHCFSFQLEKNHRVPCSSCWLLH